MHYLCLAIGIATEVFGSTLLRCSDGFRNKKAGIGCLIAYAIAYYLVAVSMRELPLNIAYATWCGVGTLCTMLIGVFYFKEKFRRSGYVGLVILLGGIIALNLL